MYYKHCLVKRLSIHELMNPSDEEGLFNFDKLGDGAGAILVIALGVGVLMSGVVGWGNEREAAARAAGQPLRTASTGTAMLETRIEQLTVQLGLELHAGHCSTVTTIAHRLEALGHPVDATCPR